MRVSARQATLSLVQKMGKFRRRSASMARCTLKCCQSCRPYFKDRTFMSFDSVFANEIDPLESTDGLPVADVAIVRKLGLRQHSRTRPVFTEENSSEGTSSSDFSSPSLSGSDRSNLELNLDKNEILAVPLKDQVVLGRSQGSSVVNVPRTLRSPNMLPSQTTPPGPHVEIKSYTNNPTLEEEHHLIPSQSDPDTCVSTVIPSRALLRLSNLPVGVDPKDEDFDREFGRLQSLTPRSKGSVDLVSTAGLREEIGMGEWLGTVRRGSASSSTYSEEIAVDGGVALTEEAVETQTPDIITQA
jgi:hypothetical protein